MPKDIEAPLLACTVIVPSVEIGDLICGDGHKIKLTQAEADALLAMPPAIRVDGI
ncbi:MAG: hypothetical protein ABIS50_11575 [Luteolibacter sp.]|uniref:hypothetical protein n=1 Tax=Luteolibacter sp. TaxID=1962973 RepID=UPI003267D457